MLWGIRCWPALCEPRCGEQLQYQLVELFWERYDVLLDFARETGLWETRFSDLSIRPLVSRWSQTTLAGETLIKRLVGVVRRCLPVGRCVTHTHTHWPKLIVLMYFLLILRSLWDENEISPQRIIKNEGGTTGAFRFYLCSEERWLLQTNRQEMNLDLRKQIH